MVYRTNVGVVPCSLIACCHLLTDPELDQTENDRVDEQDIENKTGIGECQSLKCQKGQHNTERCCEPRPRHSGVGYLYDFTSVGTAANASAMTPNAIATFPSEVIIQSMRPRNREHAANHVELSSLSIPISYIDEGRYEDRERNP